MCDVYLSYFALVIAVVGVARWSALMDCFLYISVPDNKL